MFNFESDCSKNIFGIMSLKLSYSFCNAFKIVIDLLNACLLLLQVRNLCYMISRREKERRRFYKTREEVFKKQLQVIMSMNLSQSDLEIVIDANHSDTIYDNPQQWNFTHVSYTYICQNFCVYFKLSKV